MRKEKVVMGAVNVCATCALGFVFLFALGGKTLRRSAYDAFVASLEQYGFRGAREMRRVARVTVCAEVGAVAALVVAPIAGWQRELQFGPAGVLLILLSIAIVRGARVNPGSLRCHCFGSDGPTKPGVHIAINLALVASAAIAIVYPGTSDASAGTLLLAGGLGTLIAAVAVTSPVLLDTLRSEDRLGRAEAW